MNELAEVNNAPGALVHYWHGDSAATVAAAAGGGQVVLSPSKSSYLDQKYHPDFPLGLDWACSGDCDFPHYYSWEPQDLIPGLDPAQIAGVEGPLWSETLRGVSQVLRMLHPRALALAELAWSSPQQRNPANFTERLSRLAPRHLLGGGNFYDGEKAAWAVALTGYAAKAGDSAARVARIAAPGGQVPEVHLDLPGVPFELVVAIPSGPLLAGPVVDVIADLRQVGAGVTGRITANRVSAPIAVV